jgi:hypothetical protein
MPNANSNSNSSGQMMMILAVLVCFCLFLSSVATGGLFFYNQNKSSSSSSNPKSTSSSSSSRSSSSSSLTLLESKLDKLWDSGVPYGIDTAKYKAKIPQIAKAILDNCGTSSFDDCVGYVKYMLDMNGAINSVYQKDNTKAALPVPWTVYNFDCTSVQKDLTSQDLVPIFNSTYARIGANIGGIPSTSTINIEKIKQYMSELTIRSMFYSTCKGGTKASDYTGCADWIVYVLNKPAYVYQFGKEPTAGDWSYGFDGALVQKT